MRDKDEGKYREGRKGDTTPFVLKPRLAQKTIESKKTKTFLDLSWKVQVITEQNTHYTSANIRVHTKCKRLKILYLVLLCTCLS